MTQSEHQQLSTPVLKITTTYDLWAYLFQGYAKKSTPHKFSKPEAFFDLIKRQRLASATKDNDFLDGSILSISQAWGWDRNAVKNFMQYLADENIISIEKKSRRTLFRLNEISLE